MTPAEISRAVELINRLGQQLSRAWPEMRAGRPVDVAALEAAVRGAHASVDALEAAVRGAHASVDALDAAKPHEIARALSARISRAEDDFRGLLGGLSIDPLALRSELGFLIAVADALAERLRQDTDRAA